MGMLNYALEQGPRVAARERSGQGTDRPMGRGDERAAHLTKGKDLRIPAARDIEEVDDLGGVRHALIEITIPAPKITPMR